jgi:hypothetical protein
MSEDITAVRDNKGRFAKGKSGNTSGRTVGSKGKHTKAKLENLLNKMGVDALIKIQEIAEQAVKSGQLALGFKCYFALADKYYSLTIHNDRVEIAAAKDAKEDNTDDMDYTMPPVQLSFVSG